MRAISLVFAALLLLPGQPNEPSTLIGYSVTYGPRENRHQITLWDDCGEFRMRLRVYGPPGDTNLTGEVLEEIETTLPQEAYEFLRNKLNSPNECVEVLDVAG